MMFSDLLFLFCSLFRRSAVEHAVIVSIPAPAAYLPAGRATRIDPMVALRNR